MTRSGQPVKVSPSYGDHPHLLATMLLSTNCLVTDAPKKKEGDDDEGGGGGGGMDEMDDM